MGTTQRILTGVTGEPNWRNLSTAVTNVARTVEIETVQNQNNGDKTLEQDAKDFKKLIERRKRHINSVFTNLINTGGGVSEISTGKSSAIGRAGLKSSKQIIGFLNSVSASGLTEVLKEIGFGNLEGKNINDIIDYLLVYFTSNNAGMDETAANKASCEVLNEIAEGSNNNLEEFEKVINNLAEGNELQDLLCRFFGYYIFEHLSQYFQEKITQKRGEEVSAETFKIIKEDIFGRILLLNKEKDVTKINWKGEEGKKTIETIFESIIKIICDESID